MIKIQNNNSQKCMVSLKKSNISWKTCKYSAWSPKNVDLTTYNLLMKGCHAYFTLFYYSACNLCYKTISGFTIERLLSIQQLQFGDSTVLTVIVIWCVEVQTNVIIKCFHSFSKWIIALVFAPFLITHDLVDTKVFS